MTKSARVVIIVQARMGSTRLPGKVLQPLHGTPMLLRQLERLARCRTHDALVVATSNLPGDDALAEVVEASGLASVVRGSEQDVLARYVKAVDLTGADVVVRVTGDCPLIDPEVVDRCVRAFLDADTPLDYVSNTIHRTFARGLDTEVVDANALRLAHAEATRGADREHVTPFLWRSPERFHIGHVTDDVDRSNLRLTVDTEDDLKLVRAIFETLHPRDTEFGYSDIIALLDERPELRALNAHVEQKPVSE